MEIKITWLDTDSPQCEGLSSGLERCALYCWGGEEEWLWNGEREKVSR